VILLRMELLSASISPAMLLYLIYKHRTLLSCLIFPYMWVIRRMIMQELRQRRSVTSIVKHLILPTFRIGRLLDPAHDLDEGTTLALLQVRVHVFHRQSKPPPHCFQ
jgi:hypothetical protein